MASIRQLTAVIAPANATDKEVEWDSEDPAVAAVDQNGLVSAVAVGETEIIVTTLDGGFTGSCHVTVIDEIVPVTGVTLSEEILTLEI